MRGKTARNAFFTQIAPSPPPLSREGEGRRKSGDKSPHSIAGLPPLVNDGGRDDSIHPHIVGRHGDLGKDLAVESHGDQRGVGADLVQ